MASGADSSGDRMTVGRTNKSEERTLLLAQNGENAPDGYAEDFVLDVSIVGGHVLTNGPHGVDGIHATGSTALPTGGAAGTLPPGNGIIARGLNGLVGYVHAALRDKSEEMNAQAGATGEGGTAAAGVFGRGQSGVVGCEQTTPRDTAFEAAEMAGVLGRGQTGVAGDGVNGPGVHGRGSPGNPGVRGDGTTGPGVLGAGSTGVFASGVDGPGVHGTSPVDCGGIFSSRRTAQLWIEPLPQSVTDPTKLPGPGRPGELCVTVAPDQRGRLIASLWFCVSSSGPASTANWLKLA